MRNWFLYVVFTMIMLAAVFAIASAEDPLPDGVQRWIDADCGLVCYVFPDGSGDCYRCVDCDLDIVPTVPVPTDRPMPTVTPVPQPTEKVKCNRGLGNGAEGCDPGNSAGRPGAAGEDNE